MSIQLRDVIKSPDVEDPVNLHIHRPLQLLLARPLVRTSITPNQVTLLSLLAGLGSAACIVVGTQASLIGGAVLLFSSAILDGVDGMIARLKKTSSEAGHAIDGASDYAVNVATTLAAIYYLAQRTGQPLVAIGLGLLAHIAWAHHLMLYDFHCAMYLRFYTGGRHSGGDRARAAESLARLRERKAPLFQRAVMTVFVWQLGNREGLLRRVNPRAVRLAEAPVSGPAAEAYVAAHRKPMRLWALLGNAPHMDLMALATAFGRFEIYFVARIVVFTLLGVAAAVWERRVTRRDLDLEGSPA
ncbi:CDP-alcohol phosphatidyltransferase family protein [Chondromyces apiculatus]|uniref:CDP-alcohol phosphatidyltransferase n=1 Tax=Chondromyces apiculatus DSM 436 TaxID=1192034 RepID=A0A017TIE9_9BACT|nr:CDP-alcohol phosphatidyltransferase family protein [Chondromyces apiculatus]EYF08406.1 Hypothetical protein CAP_3935 [Chondromyces apiculatus DSM 436]